MKKSALKNRIKSYWGKHKTTIFVVALSFQLAIGLTIYFLFGRISPNDDIFVPKEGSVAFLMNENPRFSVDFGKVKEPDKQWVRFEAQTSAKNPFEEESGNIFTKIAKLFQKKERYGIEMSLVGVDLKGEELKKYGDEVILVADVIGTDSVKTSTELIDVGREIGVYEDQEVPVSKQTVLNKDVADGVDLEYQILKGLGLKEEIIIRDLEAYKDSCKEKGCSLPVNEFVFDLKMDSNVELKEGWFTVDGQSTSTYYFVDSKGRYIAHFLPNFAIDNINNKTFDVNLKVEKGEDNNYRAEVTVNLEWLLSSERVFPVRIDPSIVHDDTADFSGGIFNWIESVTGPKVQIEGSFDCSGGTETLVGRYKIHTFTTSGTLVCDSPGNVEVLVVAGGGGGGTDYGGGGGAGGVIHNSSFAVSAGSYSVTIGNGGSAESTGGNSVFSTLTAYGGGAGGRYGNGGNGGSGGGSGYFAASGGIGVSGQGNNGGSSVQVNYRGSGGGGATQVGFANNSSTYPGWGGAGYTTSISGISSAYGGGGGAAGSGGTSGFGGVGGGGNGGGGNGVANTGGGGGSCGGLGCTAGVGGSGIVIVKHILPVSGEYISSSMDMGSSMSEATLSWTPSGVNTGNGETPYSTTGLVAQWNFNETSGTTADNVGSCGATCDGTLASFASTGSQDAAAGTGWTANNKRWGAGALMFDGTDDNVNVGDLSNLELSSVSLSAWVKLTDKAGWLRVAGKFISANFQGYQIGINGTGGGTPYFQVGNGTANSSAGSGGLSVYDSQWHYLVGTFDGTNLELYIDGVNVGSNTSTAISYASEVFYIGSNGSSSVNGIIDSVSVYSRALSADEVLSNYQAGNIEFQYRVSADNSTWSSWTSYNDGALLFDGTDDYVNVGSDSSLNITGDLTIESWVNWRGKDSAIISWSNGGTYPYHLVLLSSTQKLRFNSTTTGAVDSTATFPIGVWTHIAVSVIDGGVSIYINGALDSSTSVTTGSRTAGSSYATISRAGAQFFDGTIDSVKVYSRALGGPEIAANYAMVDKESPSDNTSLVASWDLNELSGTTATNGGSCGASCDGTLTYFSDTSGKDVVSNSGWTTKTARGSNSLWESFDNPYLYETDDSGAIGYWPMDEVSGTGAYILDKTGGYSIFATGGTVTTSGGYTIHTFTSNGTFVVNGSGNVEVLVVAGGGGGGGNAGGGGGGGGVVYSSSITVPDGNNSVTVGAGGAINVNGGNSVFGSLTAVGGGAGGHYPGTGSWDNGNSGGSGGGGSIGYPTTGGTGGAGTSGQGYAGGNGAVNTQPGAAGGGGAGAIGSNGGIGAGGGGGNGGIGGNYSSIFGTSVGENGYFGGGGGGGRWQVGVVGTGGLGGGGNGGSEAGTVNTGGGGGGGNNASNGAAGGSGIVIIRYPSTYQGSYVYSNGTPTNTTFVGGKSAGARSFNGSSSYINFPDSSAFDVSNLTIEAWVYSTNFNQNGFIFEKGSVNTQYSLFFEGANMVFRTYNTAVTVDNLTFATSTYFNNSAWNHVVCTYDGSNKKVYVNGVLAASNTYTQTLRTGQTGQRIGAYGGATPAYFFNGIIDEVRVFNTALSASAIASDYTKGIMNKSSVVSQKPGSIKMEGAGSTQLTSGSNVVDSNTVALWHLDERGGSGAYLKDSSVNSYNATPSGTTYAEDGKVGGARALNGTSHYIDAPDIDTLVYFTYEVWVKLANTGRDQRIFDKQVGGSLWPSVYMVVNSANTVTFGFYKASSTAQIVTSTATLSAGTYHHLAGTYDGSNVRIYINGVLNNTAAATGTPNNIANNLTIGAVEYNTSPYYRQLFGGTIDEVRISNIARTANEVANSYRLGRDTYVNKAVDVRDLSSLTTLPIYVAGDRPGSYLNTIWGETGYSNYQPDANTIGLWHLDEASGTGAYLLDSSGMSKHGTPTGTTYTTSGRIGSARSFNGTSDYIGMSNISLADFSMSMWIYPTSWTNQTHIALAAQRSTTTNGFMFFVLNQATLNLDFGDGTSSYRWDTGYLPPLNQWTHLVVTRSSSGRTLYVNGQVKASTTIAGGMPTATVGLRIGADSLSATYFYQGSMDEVRISSIARTADEIRQSYEVGLRTHPVTVDFGASLVSGNLITGSGDTSFSIDATVYGLDALGSGIYKDEKIIVKENYDGTEYIAQGTVSAVTSSTGAVTVSSWDTGSTFPSAGYTVNADVFKWQKEYIPIKNRTVSTHVDAVNLLSFNITNGNEGRNIWIDDLRSTSGYLSTYTGEELTFPSSGRYFQYKAVFNTWDSAVTPYLSQVQLDYQASGPTMDQIMRHGKWFDGSGAKQPFWWAKGQ